MAKNILVNNILVVDDEPAVLRGTCRALRSLGHKIWGAGSVAAALELSRDSGPFDAIVSDYDLGDGTGADVYQAFHAPDRFILYTANHQARVGGAVHIHKPNIIEVQEQLAFWLG
jgi:CheY-like chemotaxis protein